MSDNQEQEASNQISIQDLEQSLDIYEIESDQKLQKLKSLFDDKKSLDLRQVFYQQRSSIQVKFQNIIGDLTQFLINQQVPSTEKLRKTFYRILQSPLILLFKVSRFQIFNLRLNAFDIQLEPIQAICELANLIYKNIDEYVAAKNKFNIDHNGSFYQSYQQFLSHAKINLISDQIFILYSYLRKGSNILKKKLEDKIKIVQIFNTIEQKLIQTLIKNQDVKTLKQLSVLNYELYLLENNFDAICFYLKIPFHKIYRQVFKQLEILAQKAKLTSNYDMFIHIFVKFNTQILNKIQQEGIDQCYSSYIQNGMRALLELWGCRICHFKQFFTLFKSLSQIYPDKKTALKICLKHEPNLSKQDIALIRANYRQNIQSKKNQFLSLLKNQTLQQINVQLNSLYHRILYNLDFSQCKKQEIIELLTLVNGNSSIQQFFMTTQKAFKQWNHTIDFNNHHKFIQSQFNLALKKEEIFQSLRLFTNLCILEDKGFNKQFQNLVAKGSINKILLGIIKFILNQQKLLKLFEQNQLVLNFIIFAFKFLQRTLSVNSKQWQDILYQLASLLKSLSNSEMKKSLQQQLTLYIVKNAQNFYLSKLINIFKKITENSDEDINQLIELVINLFMQETQEKCRFIKMFRFFGKDINSLNNQQVTNQESDFLKKYAQIDNGIIQIKDNSCLKLSELQVITNPIHFQKAMDSYYFTLDSNSKRFVQYVVEECFAQVESSNKFYHVLIKTLIKKYPICLPILCNVRNNLHQNSNDKQQHRFVQNLVNKLNSKNSQNKQEIKDILQLIMNCNQIKYRNGKDYVSQQIVPMILKRTLMIINEFKNYQKSQLTIQIYLILTMSLSKIKLTQLKLDTIQKTVARLNMEIVNSKCEKNIIKLTKCVNDCIRLFFKKKQIEIKKTGLTQTFQKIIWNQIRSYNLSSGSTFATKKLQSNIVINDHIMVSPYTLSQQYNLDEYKIKKSQNSLVSTIKKQKNNCLKLQKILPFLTISNSSVNSFSSSRIEQSFFNNPVKKVDLSHMEYNIDYHLGKQSLNIIQNKQNIQINQKFNQKNKKNLSHLQDNQKSVTFVQYYLRQMNYPEISDEMIFKIILGYLKNEIQLSYLWTNPHNLQKLFVSLNIIFDYAVNERDNKCLFLKQLKQQNQYWQSIIVYLNENSLNSIKKILTAFSLFGYNNLWGQNYKSLNLLSNIRKILQIKQIQDESFLSIFLKKCLQFQQISQIKQQLNLFLDKVFTTRPAEQTSLMYKVGIDKNLLNLIMKSLEIQNLNNISFLFHSNFNNLRLYTDQLHQGLKALNMASKTRSYNQYIQLAKQIDDQQFLAPMKLFQQNFKFFIKIQKQGYNFKKAEQKKLALQRLVNVLRNYQPENKQKISKQCDEIILQYLQQIQKLQINIANRVKSFYLVTKLRDLSYQNSVSISLIRQILKLKNYSQQNIIKQIKKIQIFSLLLTLYKQLVLFGNDWQNQKIYQKYNKIDRKSLIKQVSLNSTLRFSHSMNRIYQKCDIELDQLIQRCLDQLKLLFYSEQGVLYLQQNKNLLYPPFMIKSFINKNQQTKQKFIQKIKSSLQQDSQNIQGIKINLTNKNSLFTQFVTQVRSLNKKRFLKKDLVCICYEGKTMKIQQFLSLVVNHIITAQTLIFTKSKQSKFLFFNKYKTSEPTLQQIQTLGYLIGYIIYHNIKLVQNNNQILALHSSIISALNFNIADIDDVLNIDFKIWEDLKKILSVEDSKTLNLNFSYIFENIKTLQPQRIQLVDKGASKKVNNLNRNQFCDAIACHVLYKNVNLQINRFLQAILSIVPKQLLSTLSISDIYPLFYNKINYDLIMKKYMKKIGIVTPQIVFNRNGQRIENLKDYQNIQWAVQILLQNQTIKQKLWKNQTNLFIVTTIGNKGNCQIQGHVLVIQHFQSKSKMLDVLKKL